MIFTKRLTNLQLELIRLFEYQLPDNQIIEIKDLLARYFAEQASKEMDKLWDENQWSNETMVSMVNEHIKTPCGQR